MSGHSPALGSGRPLSRRRLLGLGAGLTAGLGGATAGCSTTVPLLPDRPRERAACVARSSLPRYGRLAGLPLVYEVNRRRSEFALDEGFAGQLETWLTELGELTGWRLDQLWTYGTWTDGADACSSWHNAGRALDLAALRLDRGSDVSCRYDLWRNKTGRSLTSRRRAYWAVAASAHLHFSYVLTYLYNTQHHNHIHIDNGRSGNGPSTFSTRSRTQIQAVQAICTHLWDIPVEVTGQWDGPTRNSLGRLLADLGQGEDLTDRATWSAFLTASIRRG